MSLSKSIILIIIGIVLIFAGYSLGGVVKDKQSSISKLDNSISTYIVDTKTTDRTNLMKEITYFGNGNIVVIIAIIAVIIMILFHSWKIASATALGLLIMNAFTSYLKNNFHRARPVEMLSGASGYSYPSGHTTGIMIICFMVGWFIIHTVKNKWLRGIGVAVCVIVGILVSGSRVFLNVHWFSDVIGGTIFAVGVGLIIVGIIKIVSRRGKVVAGV